jgi:hypothetical protein
MTLAQVWKLRPTRQRPTRQRPTRRSIARATRASRRWTRRKPATTSPRSSRPRSNPSPAWAYGWDDGTGFHAYADHCDPDGVGVAAWYTQVPGAGPGSLGDVEKNVSGQVIHPAGTTTFQPDQVAGSPERWERNS